MRFGLADEFAQSNLRVEFGDFDDGLVPPLVAQFLGVPFFGRAQIIEAGAPVMLARESGDVCERIALQGRLLVSVTNDRRTRLRKPLMKNVMMARQATLGTLVAYARQTPALDLNRLVACPSARASTDCTLVAGSTADQAQALADLLWAARA